MARARSTCPISDVSDAWFAFLDIEERDLTRVDLRRPPTRPREEALPSDGALRLDPTESADRDDSRLESMSFGGVSGRPLRTGLFRAGCDSAPHTCTS